MFYYIFMNNYEYKLSNIILFNKKCTLTQSKNILIFLFDNFNFEELKDNNKITIVMSNEELTNYYDKKKDDIDILNFLKDENSIELIEKSLFGNKVSKTSFINKYNILLDFINYMKKNKYTDYIIVSGTVYLLYGLRINSDIDIMAKKRYKIRYNKSKIDLLYIEKNNNYNNLFNDKFYTFYFKGVRILTLKSDLKILRSWRAKDPNFTYPRSVANMVMAKKLIYPELILPINLEKLNINKQTRLLKKIKNDYKKKYTFSSIIKP